MNELYERENRRMGTISFSLFRWHNIPHYYGDHVRTLFLLVALLALVAIPIFGDILPFGTMAQVGAAVFLVLLAGLTNPHSRLLLIYDTVVAAVGVILLETMAITNYSLQSFPLFVIREAGAVALLFALYFAVKSWRAAELHTLGKAEQPWEFEGPEKQ